jgi:two-component system CheB/CheR fusion protein
VSDRADENFEALLAFLHQTHGFDFTGYKRGTLLRRVQKRVEHTGTAGFDEYLDYLQVHPQEYGLLFDTILINVTGFFRDASAWTILQSEALPRVLATRNGEHAQIRAWSAGCASGEEAYTMAMVLAELLGEDAVRERVKIYATDVDEEALARARAGSYTTREMAGVPDELRKRYFEQQDGTRWAFRPDLRRSVIFGRHDLVQDAPISRLDFLVCRNTLMYLTAETQARVLARLHYGLNDTGVLFLGRAEMMLTHASLFSPIDLRNRIFSKVPRTDLRERMLVLANSGRDTTYQPPPAVHVRDLAAEVAPVAQIVLDTAGTVVFANRRAESDVGIGERDLGRRFHDLEVSYRPVELRSHIDDAYASHTPVHVPAVERALGDGRSQFLDVVITPLEDRGETLGVSIGFVDISSAMSLQVELSRSKQDLETAYEELQSANEELETTNEELQSTVEELETTNEELQSANEELETMNEELQSTNGELQSINNELRDRTDQFDRTNAFMDFVLSSLHIGVVVLDEGMHVQLWNHRAADLWGLRDDEVVGHSLLTLDIGLPVQEVAALVSGCLTGSGPNERVIDARDRRGRSILCRVTCTRLDGQSSGVVATMEEVS